MNFKISDEQTYMKCKKLTMINPFTHNKIQIDYCCHDEIRTLWNNGIETTGCCCGHGLWAPLVWVKENSISRMEELGYQHAVFIDTKSEEKRQDAFLLQRSAKHLFYGFSKGYLG